MIFKALLVFSGGVGGTKTIIFNYPELSFKPNKYSIYKHL